MIRKDLLEFQYYLNRVSMFMRESYGIPEHIELFYQQLLLVNNQFDYLFEQLDIFDVKNKDSSNTFISDLIDKIGAIFGCYRNFTILLDGNYEQVSLTDEDFIVYIKCQIVKQNFIGTREELAKVYTTFENGTLTSDSLLPLTMVYVLYQTQSPLVLNSVQCNIYWTNYSQYSETLRKLFLAGYLTIESMGILYNRLTQNIDRLAIYANVLTSVENGDYYLIGETYYIWNELSGWHPSANAGSGTDLGTLTSTSELPNFGSYYCYAGQNGDYYFIRDENKFYVWNSSTKSWDEEVNEPSTGNNWGKLPSLLDLPTSLEGGFFA